MFAQADGPTALRAKLVFALALSLDQAELSLPDGDGPYCAAMAAVWNGKKGTVAVLLRHLKQPIVIRHVFQGRLASEKAVNSAVDEAVSFAESLGFTMDHPAFQDIGERLQQQRLGSWNDLRKVKSRVRHLSARKRKKAKEKAGASIEPEPPEIELEPAAIEPEPEPEAEPTAPPALARADPPRAKASGAAEEAAPGKAVLGRLALVRQKAAGRVDPLARLLSYF